MKSIQASPLTLYRHKVIIVGNIISPGEEAAAAHICKGCSQGQNKRICERCKHFFLFSSCLLCTIIHWPVADLMNPGAPKLFRGYCSTEFLCPISESPLLVLLIILRTTIPPIAGRLLEKFIIIRTAQFAICLCVAFGAILYPTATATLDGGLLDMGLWHG